MPWFNVDDGFAFHRKAVKAGNAAAGLWVRAGSWCAGQLTDGHVPSHMVDVLGTHTQARRLVAVGLWVEVEDGYQFHQWSEEKRNPTREKVLEQRKNEADRKARQRAAKFSEPQVSESRPGGTKAGVPGGVPVGVRTPPPLPSLKDKKTKNPSGSLGARGLAKTSHSAVARKLVEDYADTCRKRPPSQVLSDVAVQVDALLREDWNPEELAPVLTAWGAKGLHPKTIPSVAHEVTNSSPSAARKLPVNATDAFAAQFLAGNQPDPAIPPTLRALPGGA